MATGDDFSLMAGEVISDIQKKGVNFHKAFAWAAHRRHLWHHLERARYNAWFRIVRSRVSKREKALLKKSLEGKHTWQKKRAGRALSQASPSIQIVEDDGYLDPWDNPPLAPEDYDDNIGFVHSSDIPYLEAAPS
jgi:hypothetical protein